MNKILIKGRLTRAPEVRKLTTSPTTLTRFVVAVDRRIRSNDGKKADFFTCTAWGKTGEFIAEHFSQGSEIVVIGEMQSRPYEADGIQRVAWEIQVNEFDFCGSKSVADNKPVGFFAEDNQATSKGGAHFGQRNDPE